MGASAILRDVYQSHVDHFGEPDASITFDDGVHKVGFPDRVDVLIWRPSSDCEISTFATIGMADCPMSGAAHRAELHFAVRRTTNEAEEQSVARFLANLAMYPFQIGSFLDWWHTIRDPGTIPFSTEARSVLLYPRFVHDGWDTIHTSEIEVRILNVIPITPAERELRSREKILDALSDVDFFTPR